MEDEDPATAFENVIYDLAAESDEGQMWQTIVYVVLRSIGVDVGGEVQTHDGRIDMVVETPNDIYIVEFKLDRPAAEKEKVLGRKKPDEETVAQALDYRTALARRPGWDHPILTAVVEACGNTGYNWFDLPAVLR